MGWSEAQRWEGQLVRDRLGLKTYHGKKTVGHSGGPALADILRFPDEELTIVILTNQQRLFPRLAEGVADIFVPAPPLGETRSIVDNDEKLTSLLRGVLLDAAQGKVNADLFNSEAQKRLVPAFRVLAPSSSVRSNRSNHLSWLSKQRKVIGVSDVTGRSSETNPSSGLLF